MNTVRHLFRLVFYTEEQKYALAVDSHLSLIQIGSDSCMRATVSRLKLYDDGFLLKKNIG